jgi:hypothetical protein
VPQYRLHADHYLGGRIQKAGTVVEYDGNPGAQMEPLDDAARKRLDEWTKERAKRGYAASKRFPFQAIEAKATGTERAPISVDIPEDWRDLKGLKLTNLAKKLGAPFGVNAANARIWIEDLEASRERAITPPLPTGDDPNQALAAAGV